MDNNDLNQPQTSGYLQVDAVSYAPPPSYGLEFVGNVAPLLAALAKAQGAYKPVLRTRVNPFFKSKYADLSDVIEATREALSANGLSILQPPSREGDWHITTILGHGSGAMIVSRASIPQVADWQKLGSALTYCRRYVLSALLGVASEDDDDGNATTDKGPSPAQERYEQKRSQTPPQVKQEAPKPAQAPEPAKPAAKEPEPVKTDPEPARQPTMPPPPTDAPANPYPVYVEPENKLAALDSTKKRLGDTAKSYRMTMAELNELAMREIGIPAAKMTFEDEFQRVTKAVDRERGGVVA